MATNVSRSDFANVIIEAYHKKVTQVPNINDWLYNNIPLEVVNQKGEDKLNFEMQTQLPESAYVSGEGVASQSARVPAFVKGYTYLKKIESPMRFTEETVFLSKEPNTIVKTLENITNGTIKSYNMMREFMFHQPGTGLLATVVSATGDGTATHTIVVDSARFLRVGMGIDIYTGASANATNFTITAVDRDSNTITATDDDAGTHTIADADVIYPKGGYVSGGTIVTTRFWNGFETLIGDTDTAWPGAALTTGFDRDTQAFAKACVKYGDTPGTAQALTLGRMRAVCDLIQVWENEVNTDIIYTDPGSLNAWNELLSNKQAPTINMPTEDGWPEGTAFVYNGKRMRVVSKNLAAPETMLFIAPKTFLKYLGGDTGWDTFAGTFQKVSGYQMFERMYRGWGNLVCLDFRANGRLNDITAVV
jgi:hypothetical protein